jgi:ribonuclease T2
MALAASILACASPRSRDDRSAAPVASSASTRGAAERATFGLYVLALSWAPSFCCDHAGKEECEGLAEAYGGTHLTLHGLWPQYTAQEAKAAHASYPEFCGAFAHCKRGHDASCEPRAGSIPAELTALGPGYVADGHFLANHEWPKHGSCTGLDERAYFEAAVDAMKAIGGAGTSEALAHAVGSDVDRESLARSFGVPVESVLLSCDADCRLSQVSFCLAREDTGLPGAPSPCPESATRADYDNGCVTRGCERVSVPAAGACGASKGSTAPKKKGRGGHDCSHPGQGPSCEDDVECRAAGFLRCAKSGCCTSQR